MNQYLLEIILIIFGAFLLGYLFRHLLNDKYKRELKRLRNELIMTQANDQTAELKEQHQIALQQKDDRIDQLNTALSNAIADKVRLQDQVNRLELRSVRIEAKEEQVAPTETAPVIEQQSENDELTKIEGVGPKMAEVLKELGYTSFKKLSVSPADEIKQRLKAANPTFAVHDPTTWPEQATLALNGEWEKLQAWQKELKGGRRRKH